MKTTTTDLELCVNCRASIALTSYTLPFEEDFARAYCTPASTDKSSIESSLGDPSAELSTLAEEIQRVDSLLSALKTHHAHLERYIQRTTRFIQSSPIRRLPTEVLGIVFASACTSFQEAEYKTPLSISLVCSKWRDIAISTPHLWTNIYVAPYSRTAGVPVYQHYRQRCGGIPIFIRVEVPARVHPHVCDDDDDFPYEQTYEYHFDVMGIIYDSFPQWRHAEFYMKGEDIELLEVQSDRWAQDLEQLEAPILYSLTLALKDADTTDLPGIFRAAPSLTSVNLLDSCGSQPFSWADCPLPWRQFRRVRTSQGNPANLMVLEDNLQHGEGRTLVLEGRCKRSMTDSFLSLEISFTCLITTLILNSEDWNDDVFDFFTDPLAIPALKNLALICRRRCYYNPLLVLPQFLQSLVCELSTFSLVMHGRGPTYIPQPTLADTLVDALHEMGHLKSLQVIESDNGPPLLSKRLFEELSTDALLPELTSLELVWAEDRQPDRELLSALSARADGRLSSVVLGVRNGGNLGPDVLECMQGLRQNNIQATCW